ncbi:TetR/AcrR family transcriptional regulator [uncultured Roseibium sp.]|uniref:TetR/AcrR family transcriptional regulator n=1 Tax=uncultured Roseibium sp. TaxID=1936171 RepID=UPI003216A0AC
MSRPDGKTPHKPRKTPRQARSGATVDAILEAAARILERSGFDGYSTNAIARRAGVSIGSLYQYFPGKDAITAALIEREQEALWKDIARIEAAPGSSDPLRSLIMIAVTHQLRRPVLARILDVEEQRLPRDIVPSRLAEQLITTVNNCVEAVGYETHMEDMTTARDIIAIIRGMVDAAGQYGEHDMQALANRIYRAVAGYLSCKV